MCGSKKACVFQGEEHDQAKNSKRITASQFVPRCHKFQVRSVSWFPEEQQQLKHQEKIIS